MIGLYIWIAVLIIFESFPVSSSAHVRMTELILDRWDIAYRVLGAHPSDVIYFFHGPLCVVIALFFYCRWRILFFHPLRLRTLIGRMLMLGFLTEIFTLTFYYFFLNRAFFGFPFFFGLFVTSVLLFSLRGCPGTGQACWNWRTALVLGIVQGCALLPGISRFASTFVAARWLGFAKHKAFELSFLIEWPLLAAGFIKGAVGLSAHHQIGNLLNITSALVILVASAGAYGGLILVNNMITYDELWLFGWYVLAAALGSLML